ncbi:MAG TPA: universal stress protein [Mycobacteriales bacterium]
MRIEDAVVVGIEAGDPDRPLLGWAAEEAAARKVGVVVCHVWEWGDVEHAPRLLPDVETAAPTPAEVRVREAVRRLREWYPDVDVSAVFAQGRPARTLLHVSERARLLVVGARGRGGFAGLQLGSVSAHLAAHARCPVAVVRPPSTSVAVDVVAGVDGWPGSERTVRLAAEEAERLGGKLVLVHGYRLPLPAEYGPNPGIDEPHRRAEAEDLAERAAASLAGVDLDVEARAVHGAPAAVLLDAAADAAVLVVGARGVDGVAGLALGSVSQQVLRHAPCTTVVAR